MPGKKYASQETAKNYPYIKHFTMEEMSEVLTIDHELLEESQQEAIDEGNKPGKLEYLEDMKKRLADPVTKARYERAYKIYMEQLYKPDLLHNQLTESEQDNLFICDDNNLVRMTSSIVDVNKTDVENKRYLSGNSPRALRDSIRKMMKADLSGMLTLDPDAFLDSFEKSDCGTSLGNCIQLQTIFDSKGLWKEDGTLDKEHALYKKYARIEPEKAGDPVINPDGLTDMDFKFLKEQMAMFSAYNACVGRLIDMASPFGYLVPDTDLEHQNMAKDTYADDNSGGFLGKNNAMKFTDGVQATNSQGIYAQTFKKQEYSKGTQHSFPDYHRVVNEHPEIAKNGWLDADFSATVKQADGSTKDVDKHIALVEYEKNPQNVEFKLNDYGKSQMAARDEVRQQTAELAANLAKMEKDLNKIYGAEWNASPEFNAFAKSFKELKKSAAAEQGKFAPNLEKLSDMYADMQNKAAEYEKAKEAEIRETHKNPNSKRLKRMQFARMIANSRGPLAEKQAEKSLNALIDQKQLELRTLIEDGRNAEAGKDGEIKTQAEKDAFRVKLTQDLKNNVAEIMAAQTILGEVKKNGKNMDKNMLDSFTNRTSITKAAADIKNSKAFEKSTEGLFTEKDFTQLLNNFEDVAATKKASVCLKNGVKQMHQDLLGVSKKLTQDKVVKANIKNAAEKQNEKKATL